MLFDTNRLLYIIEAYTFTGGFCVRPSTPLKILGQEVSAQLDKGVLVFYRDTLIHAKEGNLVTWLKSS